MNLTHILETVFLVLAAYLLGCTIGYATRRILHAGRGTRKVTAVVASVSLTPAETVQRSRRVMTPAARLAAAVSDDPAPPVIAAVQDKPVKSAPRQTARLKSAGPKSAGQKSPEPKPAAMSKPRANGADDLKQIKGIGPKIEAALNELGVYHFDQIAAWSRTNIDWVDKQLSFKGRIGREHWVEQAAALVSVAKLSA